MKDFQYNPKTYCFEIVEYSKFDPNWDKSHLPKIRNRRLASDFDTEDYEPPRKTNKKKRKTRASLSPLR